MKFKIFATVISLWTASLTIANADTITYSPQWEKGDTVRYESYGTFEANTPIFPILQKTNSQVFDIKLITRHEVIEKTADFTEFAVSLEKIEFNSPLLDLMIPEWRIKLPKVFKIDIEGLENLVYGTNGLFHYQMDSDGEVVKFTRLEKWIPFYNQYLSYIDPDKREYRVTDKSYNSALQSLEYRFNRDIPLVVYFGFHDKQFWNQKFELNSSISSELAYKNSAMKMLLPGEIQASKLEDTVQVHSHYLFSHENIHPILPKQSYRYRRDLLSLLSYSTNPIDALIQEVPFLDAPQMQGIEFTGTLDSKFHFNPNQKFPSTFSHTLSLNGTLHPNQFYGSNTRSPLPVPFNTKIYLTSTKLSESRQGGAK